MKTFVLYLLLCLAIVSVVLVAPKDEAVVPGSIGGVATVGSENADQQQVGSTKDITPESSNKEITEDTTGKSATESSDSSTEESTTAATTTTEGVEGTTVSAKKSSETSDSSDEPEEPPELEFMVMGEPGTSEDNPYIVSTKQDIRTALVEGAKNRNLPLFIKFANDINYQDIDNFYDIYQNVTFDGGKYGLFYTGSNVAESRFRVMANNLTVTFKNLKIGDKDHSAYTYYSMITDAGRTNTKLVFQDINYYATSGAQPFYLRSSSTTLILRGTNLFDAPNAVTASQEWIEGNKVRFDDNSNTVIRHYTTGTNRFWAGAGAGEMTVGKNAVVKIDYYKRYLFNDLTSLTIHVEEGGRLQLSRRNEALSFTYYGTTWTHFILDKNARVDLITNGLIDNPGSISLETKDAASFALDYMGNVGPPPNERSWTMTNSSTQAKIYWLATKDSQMILDPVTGKEKRIDGSGDFNRNTFIDFGLLNTIALTREITLDDWQVSTEVDQGVSNIISDLNRYEPSVYPLEKLHYKLADHPLVPSGSDLTSAANQKVIEDAPDADLVKSGISTKNNVILEKVWAGTYYLYEKVDARVFDDDTRQNYVQHSLWNVKEVVVPKSKLAVSVPTKLAFKQQRVGSFIDRENIGEITNLSNYPLIFTVTGIKETKTNPIRLLPELTGEKDELSLDLMSSANEVLGPLKIGENNVAGMRLVPYTGKDIFFRGNFSGKQVMHREVDYQLEFKLTDEEGNVPSGG